MVIEPEEDTYEDEEGADGLLEDAQESEEDSFLFHFHFDGADIWNDRLSLAVTYAMLRSRKEAFVVIVLLPKRPRYDG